MRALISAVSSAPERPTPLYRFAGPTTAGMIPPPNCRSAPIRPKPSKSLPIWRGT